MTEQLVQVLKSIVRADLWSMNILRVVAGLSLPDSAIGAGFVRNLVWDHLHGFAERTPLPDIDVLYCDTSNLSEAQEKTIEKHLRALRPDVPWSVKNQARMHLRNGDKPYQSTEDAMRYWLETPTAVALRLEADESLTVLAPFGIDGLMNMTVRPTPRGLERFDAYQQRMQEKNWPARWPRVEILEQ